MKYIKLDECCKKITDYVASGSFASLKENVLITKEPNYALMVKTADFANGFSKDLTYTDKHGYDFLSNSNLFGGEVILSNIGSIGKVFIVPNLGRPMTLASNSIMVKPNTNYRNRYLYYYFLSSYGQNSLKKISSGTSMQKFNKTMLKTILIQDRSIDDQDIVIASLDKINEALTTKTEELHNLDELVKSRFIEIFGERFTKDNLVKLKEICNATIGLTYKPENVSEDGTIVLRSGNIQNNELYLKDDIVRVSNIDIKEDKWIKENDILMCSRNGSARLVGKSCLISETGEQMTFGAFMTVIRTEFPFFLQSFFCSDFFKQQLTGTKTASVNQITTKMLYDYTAIQPSIEEEKSFSEFVKQIDKSKFIVQKQIEDLQELLDSKMDEYFG